MNKLARYIIIGTISVVVCALLWYFRSILVYIVVSAVIAMIGRPLVRKITSFKVGKFQIPSWVAAMITLVFILGTVFSLSFLISPFISQISNQLASLNTEKLNGVEVLNKVNEFMIRMFPALTQEFRVETIIMEKLKEIATIGNVSGVISSVVGMMADAFVAIFSICFISFFFLSKEGTFTNITVAALPDG